MKAAEGGEGLHSGLTSMLVLPDGKHIHLLLHVVKTTPYILAPG